MNEIYGLAPNACETLRELHLTLKKFGPQSGRYILKYPDLNAWKKLVYAQFQNSTELDKKRLAEIFNPFNQNTATSLIDASHQDINITRTWDSSKPWIESAITLWSNHPELKKIYVSENDYHEKISLTESLSNTLATTWDTPSSPICEIPILTTPDSYWDVSKILCSMSSEIHFIDPYFDPSRNDRKGIFEKYITEICNIRKVEKIFIWSRHNNVEGNMEFINRDIKRIFSLASKNSRTKIALYFHAIDDTSSADRLHARFLITDKGGIKFDQGFQSLGKNRTNLATPLEDNLRHQIFEKFSRMEFDFDVKSSIELCNKK